MSGGEAKDRSDPRWKNVGSGLFVCDYCGDFRPVEEHVDPAGTPFSFCRGCYTGPSCGEEQPQVDPWREKPWVCRQRAGHTGDHGIHVWGPRWPKSTS